MITKVKYIVELKDRVLAPWGPSSISAIAELAHSVVSHFEEVHELKGHIFYRQKHLL